LEPRLQRRYRQLVLEHLHVSDPLAAGIHALAVPGLADGFAAVLGAHRFLYNDAVTLPRLIEPLHHLARRWRQRDPRTWGLVVHDWSLLSYPTHRRKTDQAKVNNGRGYDLTTLLLVEGKAGDPVAPLEVRLRSAKGVFSTRAPAPGPKAYRIDEVLPSMQAVADLGLGGPLVHVIDREADALAQYRAWQAGGHHFLVRANGTRKVRWQGEEVSAAQLAGRLSFRRCREVTYKGHQAVQHVAEAEVVLDRPAWRKRRRGGRLVNERVPGPPLTLRLVVSRVCDTTGRTLAVWYLLTNVPAEVFGVGPHGVDHGVPVGALAHPGQRLRAAGLQVGPHPVEAVGEPVLPAVPVHLDGVLEVFVLRQHVVVQPVDVVRVELHPGLGGAVDLHLLQQDQLVLGRTVPRVQFAELHVTHWGYSWGLKDVTAQFEQ
jgi:hypothetical protein